MFKMVRLIAATVLTFNMGSLALILCLPPEPQPGSYDDPGMGHILRTCGIMLFCGSLGWLLHELFPGTPPKSGDNESR